MPGYATDDQLATFLDILLKPEPGATRPDWWTDAITRANAAAWGDIASTLGARGFGAAQVAGYARGQEFQLRQGLYYLALWGRIDTPINGQDIDQLDVRKELTTIIVADAGGAPVVRAGTPANRIGHGKCLSKDETFRDPTTGKFRSW